MPEAAPPSPPAFRELQAPSEWAAIDFISDLHLAADMPATFEAWASHMRHTEAEAVFILGDLFEVWVGDDARHEGFEARCAEVLTDAARRRTVAFMAGNRDFLVGDALLRACGVLRLADPTVLIAFGGRLLLTHGDALCLSDTAYQGFRATVRGAAWQADFLERPLSDRRALARHLRAESEQRKSGQGVADWVDVDAEAAVGWMREAHAPTLIHGHTHRPGSESLTTGFTRHVLSDWDVDHDRGMPRAEVLRLRRQGLARIVPARATVAP